MKRKTIIFCKTAALILSAIVASFGLFRLTIGDFYPETIGLLIWVISPYAFFLLVTYLLERLTSIPQVPGIGFVISILITFFSLLIYLPSLNHESSTEGLIFIFVPLWIFFGGFPLLGLCVLGAWLQHRESVKKTILQ